MANMSTGRGGNIGNGNPIRDDSPTADTLATPALKSNTYTTGRGGSGNMAKNDPQRPELARAAQDVTLPPERDNKVDQGMHHGRGGEGNVVPKGRKEEVRTAGGAKEGAIDGKGEMIQGQQKTQRSGSKGVLDAAREGLKGLRRGSSSTGKE